MKRTKGIGCVSVIIVLFVSIFFTVPVFARGGGHAPNISFPENTSPEEMIKVVCLHLSGRSDEYPGSKERYDIAEDQDAQPIVLLSKNRLIKDELTGRMQYVELYGGYIAIKARQTGAKITDPVEKARSFVVFHMKTYNYDGRPSRNSVTVDWRGFSRDKSRESTEQLNFKVIKGFDISTDGEIIGPFQWRNR